VYAFGCGSARFYFLSLSDQNSNRSSLIGGCTDYYVPIGIDQSSFQLQEALAERVYSFACSWSEETGNQNGDIKASTADELFRECKHWQFRQMDSCI
jgi:hypothetical protein